MLLEKIFFRPITFQDLVYPPDYSSKGKLKRNNVVIRAEWYQTNAFSVPVIMTSDLHHRTMNVFQRLMSILDISKYVVITAGDMAGKSSGVHGIRGSDNDPTEAYQFILKHAKLFYFIQGNHDLPHSDHMELRLKNADGTRCSLHNTVLNIEGIGTIGGVDGIISNKSHPYKLPKKNYRGMLKGILRQRIKILVTHETPAIKLFEPRMKHKMNSLIGKDRLFELVMRYSPKIHLYGHCHHPKPIIPHVNTIFVNADSRVLIFEPIS